VGGVVRRVTGPLVEGLGGLLLALAFCALGLAEAGAARRRLVRAVPDRATPAVLHAVDEAVAAFRRYAWVKTLTSAITGATTALAALALGLPLAWVWGFLTFLFEYVPSVGSVLAVIPPTLMALADGGPARAAVTFAVIGTLQMILGQHRRPEARGALHGRVAVRGPAGDPRLGMALGAGGRAARRADDGRDGDRLPAHAGRARHRDAARRRVRRGARRCRRHRRALSVRTPRRAWARACRSAHPAPCLGGRAVAI
jgi:hypothetical protein